MACPRTSPRSSAARVRFGVMVVALVVLAAACGVSRDAGGTAATVQLDDQTTTEITFADLNQIVGGIQSSPEFTTLVYAGADTTDIQLDVLNRQIIDVVLDDQLATVGVTVSDADREAARLDLRDQLLNAFASADDPSATTDEVSEQIDAYLVLLADIGSKRDTLGAALVGDAGDPGTSEVPCASHILVETSAEADEILSELEGGADFAQLAGERSLDPGSGSQGGSLGCSDPARYVDAFRTAIETGEVGVVMGPVETQFGFHIIVIDRIEVVENPAPTADELADEAISTSLFTLFAAVDPSIGVWDPNQTRVVRVG